MISDPNDSDRASGAPTPAFKAKKRVGWHTSSDNGGSGSGGTLSKTSPLNDGDVIVDQIDAEDGNSCQSSPGSSNAFTPTGAPDAAELRLALSKVLSAEQDDKQREDEQQIIETVSIVTDGVALPRAPRPALRRNTSYDVPQERDEADKADMKTPERQVRSITDARQRADRLAVSVGTHSHSAPGSRRNSSEVEASFDPLINYTGHRDESLADNTDTNTTKFNHQIRQRMPHRKLRKHQSQANQKRAETLMRTHTGRARGSQDLFRQAHISTGTTTLTNEQDYAEEYVPRPSHYRGGILSSLLKLHRNDRGSEKDPGGSGLNTPSAPATPLMSPYSSPSTSRRSSITGNLRRPSSGLFNYHRSHNSTSSLTLTNLLKSSSMFAAPGSSEISDQWGEKIKKDKVPPLKPKKEKIRITVHIAGILARHKYLLKLCRALMMYGAPTHRLEEYMTMSARVLEIEGQFLYLPSCMIISFDDSTTHTAEVKLVRVPQGVDLGRLRDIHNIYKDVVHDKVGVEDATSRLDVVMERKPKFSIWFRVFMYGIASVCVAPFAFEGRFIDLPFAFLLGCLVGLLQLVLAPSNDLYANVFEVSAAVATSFIARGVGSIRGGQLFCFSALAQSSIALILPGYMVLCSSLELQSHNIVAGSVRMVYAMIYTLFLGYGITIGASLYGMMDKHATSAVHCEGPLNRGWYFLFVPGFALSLCIINQAKWKQMPVMTAMALAGWSVNSYCSDYFKGNSQISNMLGALAVGILANLYSRLGNHAQNAWLDLVEWWHVRVLSRFSKKSSKSDAWSLPTSDIESRAGTPEPSQTQQRKVGYSLAAAAMLPAIFVQVPSGLAAGGSLLAGVISADQITSSNGTQGGSDIQQAGNLDGTAFNVLLSVIQVAIGISVGLFLSALIVYPLGKRRSGLFSF